MPIFLASIIANFKCAWSGHHDDWIHCDNCLAVVCARCGSVAD